jgi:uncharacterized protein (DUF305 family)
MTKKNARSFALVGAAITTTIVLAGCTINIGTPGGAMNESNMMGSSNASGSQSSDFSSSDVMFAQMMIPHHQQAVDMSELALTTSSNPEVLALAKQIRDAQAPEIELMNSWIDSAGASSHMGHDMGDMGMDGMGGMMSDDEMSALKNATGSAFDTLYLEGMIAHHEGALQMVSMIENSNNAEVKKLGDAIVTSQTAEIAQMKTMLGK